VLLLLLLFILFMLMLVLLMMTALLRGRDDFFVGDNVMVLMVGLLARIEEILSELLLLLLLILLLVIVFVLMLIPTFTFITFEEGTDEEESLAVDYMFTIEARGRGGVPRNRGGEKFAVTITGPEGPVEDVVVEDLRETHPGKYKVFYTLPGRGKYIIKATLNGKDIKGSPWRQKL